MYNDGAWPVHPGQGFEDDMMNGGVHTTWTGPISTQMYGTGLTDLCNRTRDNINRLSLQMQKLDPCFEYGIKHWHPTKRPKSGRPIDLLIDIFGIRVEHSLRSEG